LDNWNRAFPFSKENYMQIHNSIPRLVFLKNKEIRAIGGSGSLRRIEEAILQANGGENGEAIEDRARPR
jgi:hypothetical protein